MNDFQQQLKDFKKETWPVKYNRWTESDVRTLIETGKCEGHSANSCEMMLHRLRNERSTKNKFCNLVHEFSEQLGKGRKLNYITEEETELIARHIVPYGRAKTTCCTYASANKLFGDGRQQWAYESKKEYEARTSVKQEVEPVPEPEPATETVVEDFAAEVERQPQTEFELKSEAFKTLFVNGMPIEKISKVLGLDVKVTNAMMVVIDHFNL